MNKKKLLGYGIFIVIVVGFFISIVVLEDLCFILIFGSLLFLGVLVLFRRGAPEITLPRQHYKYRK